jgi:dihydroflavonol-4-reductase
VFHVAADYRLWVRDPAEMYRSNVEGTRSLLEAARKQGVRRVVYTSSVATMGFTSKTNYGNVADEQSPVARGHDRALQAFEVYGGTGGSRGGEIGRRCGDCESHDADRRARYQADSDGANRGGFSEAKFPAYVETGLNLVDATECARGHVQALEKGRAGERYILGGENLTLKQILDRLAAITGLKSPTVKLPYFFALATGVVDEDGDRVGCWDASRAPRSTRSGWAAK